MFNVSKCSSVSLYMLVIPIYHTHIGTCLVPQSCLTLCDLMDCSPPGSSVHGILQARILEWVAVSFSRGSSQPRDRTQVSWIAGGFWASRVAQEYWVGSLSLLQVICPTQGSDPGLLHCKQILYHLIHQGSSLVSKDPGKRHFTWSKWICSDLSSA